MLSFADASGNIMNRLGRLGKVLDELRTYQDAQYTNLIDETDGIVGQYNAEPDIQAITGGSYIGLLNAPGGVGGTMQAMAVATVNRMVYRDNPLFNLTLTQDNTLASIYEVIRQMKVLGATIRACTVTATPVAFSSDVFNVGNGVVVASVRRPVDGVVLENSFSENVRVTCTADSYSGGATAGNEPFQVTGVGAQTDPFAFNWPLGSNGSVSVNAIDGATDQGSGNYLFNSGWDSWTDNAPDNWEITVGTAGTNIVEDTGNTYGPGSALKMVGDGSTLLAFWQQFDDEDGTTSTLQVLSQFAINVFIRRGGTAISAGVLVIELVDSGGVVVLDQNNSPCSLTVNLTGLSVFYAAYNAAWRTPEVLPDSYYIRFRLSTAINSGGEVYLDLCGLGDMSQLYTSGPYFAVFAGGTPYAVADFTTVQVTNSYGAGGSLSTFQTLLNRLLQTQQQDILFPSSQTPSVSDDLISR